MKYLTYIVASISFLIAAAFFVTALGSCALNAHAEIRAQWHHIFATEALEVDVLETDGNRLYAAGDGVHISLDGGYTWRSTEPQLWVSAISISRDAVYAGTFFDGVFRSDSHGNTWRRKNHGIRLIDRGRERGPPVIKQILVASSGTVIAVAYHQGTYISDNRGETWRSVIEQWRLGDWHFGDGVWSMIEFDGYLWAVYSSASLSIFRSPDNGETWEGLPHVPFGEIADWAVLDDRLYVAGSRGFGRWNETEQAWEDLSRGLPPSYEYNLHPDHRIQTLAVNRGRIFAGTRNNGVWVFDGRSKTWIPAGLEGFTVASLVSHQSDLYAATYANFESQGIYHASISTVQPYGKAATTWGAIKQK